MDAIVKKGEAFSYSDSDIKRFLDDDVKIRKYSELAECKTLDDIVDGKSCAIILYMVKQNFGHWTALIKNPGGEDKSFEVFDSYGIMPDDELKYIGADVAASGLNGEPQATGKDGGGPVSQMYLSNIINSELKNGTVKNMYYNKYRLQKYLKDINTCGRWCAVRCQLKRFRIDEFCLIFIEQTLEPDAYVTLLTLMNR